MMKISTILKGVAFGVALFSISQVNAAVNVNNLIGEYQFTGELTINDAYVEKYGESFITDNIVTVTIASNTAVYFDNFVWAGSTERRVRNSSFNTGATSNQIMVQTTYVDPDQTLCFANASGANPQGSATRDNWFLDLTYDADNGTLTIGDFTIVIITGNGDNDTEIVATYKNAVMTPIVEEDPQDAYDFQGVYTVSGTKLTYNDGMLDDYTTSEDSFELVIYSEPSGAQIDAIAGYSEITQQTYPDERCPALVKGDVLTINANSNKLLSVRTEDGYYIALGGADVAEEDGYPAFNNSATISLTYADGAFTLGDFTVWSRSYAGYGIYTLLEKWTNLTVTQTKDAAGVESIDKDVNDVPAVYFNLQGVQVTNPSNGIFIKKQGDKSSKVVIK